MRLPLILLFIVSSQQLCSGLDFVGTSTGLLSFIKFLSDSGVFVTGPTPPNEILEYIKSMNKNIQTDLTSLLNIVKNLDDYLALNSARNLLEDSFRHLGTAFSTAVRKTRDIKLNETEDITSYEITRGTYEDTIDQDIANIYSILTESLVTPYEKKNFTTNLKLVENICKTGVSDYQILENLLMSLKIATGQFFVTKNLLFDIGEYTTGRSFNVSRNKLIERTKTSYKTAVNLYKVLMSNASRRIWPCDQKNEYEGAVRYTNKPDSSFYELLAFQKYYVNDLKFDGICQTGCQYDNLYHKCPSDYIKNGCSKTRLCSGKLINCNKLKENTASCDNGNATNRYTSVAPYYDTWKAILIFSYSPEFVCPKGFGINRMEALPNKQNDMLPKFCATCDCICQEKSYYISTKSVMADIHENKVVTGARLFVEDDTLYVQIQQGKLMHSGYINKKTVQWKPIKKADKNNRVMIKWDGVRAMALSGIRLPADSVIAGFQLAQDPEDLANKRMHLVTHAVTIDFNKGKIGNETTDYPSLTVMRDLDLTNRDVPTKSTNNSEIVEEDKSVEFTISNLAKDGGQTTIPFIDIQKLETKPPMPLSGAGLFHRGQKDYGGFLGLQLFVYDVLPHFLHRHSFNSILKMQPIVDTKFGK